MLGFLFFTLIHQKVEHYENSTTWHLATTENILFNPKHKVFAHWEDRIY